MKGSAPGNRPCCGTGHMRSPVHGSYNVLTFATAKAIASYEAMTKHTTCLQSRNYTVIGHLDKIELLSDQIHIPRYTFSYSFSVHYSSEFFRFFFIRFCPFRGFERPVLDCLLVRRIKTSNHKQKYYWMTSYLHLPYDV